MNPPVGASHGGIHYGDNGLDAKRKYPYNRPPNTQFLNHSINLYFGRINYAGKSHQG